jgi:hypothetical protein
MVPIRMPESEAKELAAFEEKVGIKETIDSIRHITSLAF